MQTGPIFDTFFPPLTDSDNLYMSVLWFRCGIVPQSDVFMSVRDEDTLESCQIAKAFHVLLQSNGTLQQPLPLHHLGLSIGEGKVVTVLN